MTETEWLACSDVWDMFAHIRSAASARKTRLLGCACVGWCWQWGHNEPIPEAVYVAEAFADGFATPKELSRVADYIAVLLRGFEEPWRPYPRMCELTELIVSPTDYGEIINELQVFGDDMNILTEPEWKRMAVFLRDIFGNPFRPVSLDGSWRTTDVLLLAQGIYNNRAFDRMPILADALQDAGCNNDDILTHCRDTSLTHVRGCWVVDLVLSKE